MELFDLYTADRQKTDRTMVRGEPTPKGFYRMVVHVCIFNLEGQMLIQQRQPFKRGWSNLWDVTVGGGARARDSSRARLNACCPCPLSVWPKKKRASMNTSWAWRANRKLAS